MRILHTSDWHLGKTLSGYSRAAEHEALCDELVEIAEDVDLVLVSGDVFDTYNPPIAAEEMFFDTLSRLGDGGRRAVIVLAGNHDSPDRLTAPEALSARHGVFLFGRPGDVPVTGPVRGANRIQVTGCGASWLELGLPCGERAVVAALAYPSEARLRDLPAPTTREHDLQRAYDDRIRRIFADLASHFRADAVNLATSHLHMLDAVPSESERVLVGGAWQVTPQSLPAGAHYVGLGHIHQPQAVEGAPSPTRYAGAPLAFRMSERDYAHSSVIVEASAGAPARVHTIPVSAGRPLVVWTVNGGLPEVLAGVESGLHAGALIELRLHLDLPPTHSELATLQNLPRDFTRIRTVLPAQTPLQQVGGEALSPSELFRRFVRDQAEVEPEPELVELFLELTDLALAHA